jgi:RND family efflux transporter MFP subunit
LHNRYVWLYNHQLPQKALGHVSPIQTMKQWQRSHPELFNRRVTNQPGHVNTPGARLKSCLRRAPDNGRTLDFPELPVLARIPKGFVRLVGALALAWPLLSGAAEGMVAVSPAQIQALGIESAPLAAPGSGRITLPAQVTLPNDQVHVVSAPLPAVVLQLAVAPGDAVKRGQTLARLGGAPILEAQREYLQAAAQANLAAQNARRDELLFREGIIAESRYQTTRALHAQAAALLAEKRQALKLAGADDRAAAPGLSGVVEVRAPADGVVLEQGVAVGQRVDQTALIYRIARLAPLTLEVQLPVALAAQLREGAAVRVPAAQAAGRVIALGHQVGPNQTVALRALITDGAGGLRPGQFVEAAVELPPPAPGTWRVPQAALVRQQEQLYVFVEVPGGFRTQVVKLIAQAGDTALVSGPFQGGERVAVKGVAALKASWMGLGKGQ